mmetsp:Transcript_7490/g.15513  ORF Transcript_7490/g.15513 Transcript_7490/m.15513 type:complete len:294 (+) Transcript_7490:171-1052(+)|eukprot:CAMPEP_0194341852 /NCGR_PEP_ID=MMETSP0171-20130528/91008_1 /TAXON_ID=218684 /ORGANISM="Corethron pennatum, Strain L29A3" /LENGTH=293 /DNA_ID=CAMNT_0039107347 /DNA_START=60 /DNA_END=941 /DNA_ORIENTATION=-
MSAAEAPSAPLRQGKRGLGFRTLEESFFQKNVPGKYSTWEGESDDRSEEEGGTEDGEDDGDGAYQEGSATAGASGAEDDDDLFLREHRQRRLEEMKSAKARANGVTDVAEKVARWRVLREDLQRSSAHLPALEAGRCGSPREAAEALDSASDFYRKRGRNAAEAGGDPPPQPFLVVLQVGDGGGADCLGDVAARAPGVLFLRIVGAPGASLAFVVYDASAGGEAVGEHVCGEDFRGAGDLEALLRSKYGALVVPHSGHAIGGESMASRRQHSASYDSLDAELDELCADFGGSL